MGVLTDIVIAHEREAPAVAGEAAPSRRWTGIDATGVDQVKLATLWGLLSGREFRNEWVAEFVPLYEASEDGPWVFRVPDALVQLLADVDDGRAPAIAGRWADTEELQLDEWEPDDARGTIDDLRGLARKARAAATPLLMWVCL